MAVRNSGAEVVVSDPVVTGTPGLPASGGGR